jgi:lysozyme
MSAIPKKKKRKIGRKTVPHRRSKSFLLIRCTAVLLFGLVAIWLNFNRSSASKKKRQTFPTYLPTGFASFGLDVSHHQGNIDWQALMKRDPLDTLVAFVYCKATEGSTYLDECWAVNRERLNNLGIPNGAYHFFRSQKPPKPQAFHFLAHWKKQEVDLPPALDVEEEGFSDEDLRTKMQSWLTVVEEQTGMRPIIYTSKHFFETKFKDYFPDYKFWIAAYSREPNCLKDHRIIHWQYTEHGKLPGINSEIDFNVSKIKY